MNDDELDLVCVNRSWVMKLAIDKTRLDEPAWGYKQIYGEGRHGIVDQNHEILEVGARIVSH